MKLSTLAMLGMLASNANATTLNLLDFVGSIKKQSETKLKNHKECHEKTLDLYLKMYKLPLQSVDFASYSEVELQGILAESFEIRTNIRNQLKRYNKAEPYAKKCLGTVRALTRAMRYLEDYVVQQLETNKDPSNYTTLEGNENYFTVKNNINFKDYNDLQSGDVILSRGNAYSSAAIARIGVDDGQFSHMSFVYKDPQGRLHTVEAHIELGVVVAPINKHIEQQNARTVVYRFKNQKLAHKAAEHMYKKVKAHSKRSSENIFYDFGMNYKDNSQLFCSEVVFDGFNHVSKGTVQVPLHRTTFPAKLLPFLNQIGIPLNTKTIKTFETFAPVDIEFDPRFEMIAEWRNPAKLHDLLIKDAILTKLFHWMETGYKFKPNFGMTLQGSIAWLGRRTPWLKEAFREKLPLNMGVGQVEIFLALDEVGEALNEKINSVEKRIGRTLSFNEMFKYLDNLRALDESNYKKYKIAKRKLHRGGRTGGVYMHKQLKKLPKVIFHHRFSK